MKYSNYRNRFIKTASYARFRKLAKSRLCSENLVLVDIFMNYLPWYLLTGFCSAGSFLLQIFGVTNLVAAIRGGRGRYALPVDSMDVQIFAAMFALIISGIFILAAKRISVKIMVDYERYLVQKLFQIFERDSEHVKKYSLPERMVLLSKDCRFGGRIAQEISDLVMPVAMLGVSVPVLLYLQFQATLILFLVMGLTSFSYKLIARRAREISYAFEEAVLNDSLLKKKILAEIEAGERDTPLDDAPSRSFIREYQRRLFIAHVGVFIGNIQLALCLAALAVWSARNPNAMAPSSLVLYGFVVLVTFNQLKKTPKVFTNFNVFFAYFRRAFELIHGLESHDLIPSFVQNDVDELFEQ